MNFFNSWRLNFFLGFVLISIVSNSRALSANSVYVKVKGSVFTLYSYDFATRKVNGRGTAVAIDKNILATNCHVALSGNYMIVKVGDKLKVARLFYKNEPQDLCLLEIPGVNFNPVQIRPSANVEIGEVVYAVGNPRGTEKTLSEGIISNKHPVKGGFWLQTDAAIYYGSSGGGLFDDQGRLLGITSKMGGNFGFALPSEWILQVLAPVKSSNYASGASAVDQASSSPAYENLKLIGVYGKAGVSLFRNNNECFLSVPGRADDGKVLSLTLWNPHYSKNLVVFSTAITAQQALLQLYNSILDRKIAKQVYYKSDSVLLFSGRAYQLYGTQIGEKRYPFFVVRFDRNPFESSKFIKAFMVHFQNTGDGSSNKKITYNIDGFDQALVVYNKVCVAPL